MKKKTVKYILIILGIGVPYLIIYRPFFINGPLVWGDAPFFFPDSLRNLFSLPLLWNFKDNNFGGPQYYILWLYLPTYIYGVLNHLLGLTNDILVRLIFYLPATILAFIGSWKFIGRFNQNIFGKFLGSFLYGFNTYFLMLIDGGQVGVMLAYGIFPFAVFSTLNFLEKKEVKNYLFSVIFLFVLTSADIRISLIAIFLILCLWFIDNKHSGYKSFFKKIMLLGISLIGLCSYWLVPTIVNLRPDKLNGLTNNPNSSLVNLLDSFLLYQPHFPLNQFGKVFPPPFYFIFIPMLVFGGLLFSKKKFIAKLGLLFMLLVFLTKGSSEPVGFLFAFIVNNLPFGVAFRDASKFFIPAILVGGLLMSMSVELLGKTVKNRRIFMALVFAIYIYLIFLIHPALFGSLSGVLGVRTDKPDYWKIYNALNKDNSFFRSLWFEERPALGYTSWSKPALSANTLYQEHPFASMIVGKYDFFNYLHSPQFCQWLDLVGVKYVFLPESERKKVLDESEQKSRNNLMSLVDNNKCFAPLNIGLSFPAYKTIQNKPLIFAQKKALLVIGGEEIYQQLIKLPSFSLGNQSLIFLEQGTLDLKGLRGLDPSSLSIVFSNRDFPDLTMGYFLKDMVSPSQALNNQWKIYGSDDYLVWKYELLQHDIKAMDFDFGKGVAMSTIPGEKMEFKIPAQTKGNYYLAVRYLLTQGSAFSVDISGKKEFFWESLTPQFKWGVLGPFKSDGKIVDIKIENAGNFSSLNTLVLVSEEDFQKAQDSTKYLMDHFQTIVLNENTEQLSSLQLSGLLKDDFLPVQYQQINPTEYKINNLPPQPAWLVFSDHFDPGWKLKGKESAHLPFYAMMNGFYLDGKSSDLTLIYEPQEKVSWGVMLSLISLGAIWSITIIYYKRRKN